MKIALLTTDNRSPFGDFANEVPWFGTAPEALMQGFAEIPEVEIHVISCTRKPLRSPAMLAPNIHFHSLHVPKIGWMRTAYQGCIRATRYKLREIKPDIVHGQGTEYDCAISAVFSGFPNVVTIHGKMTEIAAINGARFGSYNWCAAQLENFILPRTNGIVCISSYVKNLVRRYNVPLWQIPNALQRMFFDFPRTLEKRPIPLLINVGVLGARKRQRELLPILCDLRREGFDFETLFVGVPSPEYGAALFSELAAAQASLGKFSHVERLKDEDFCRLFDTASAMIHFSREESFGLVFAEALARNLPLFASDVGCIHDIAEGVSDVQIFPMNDWSRLKDAVRQWLREADFNRARPESSPQPIIDRYHPAQVARRHLEVYREVLGRS